MAEQIEARLKLPGEITTICKVRGEKLESFLRKLIAIELYREGIVSLGKAAEIAGVSKIEMMDLLREKGIPLNYGVEELKDDLEVIKGMR